MSEDSIANIYANSNFYKFTEMKLKLSFVAPTIIFNQDILYVFTYYMHSIYFSVLNFVQIYKNLQSSDGVVPEIIIFE